MQPANRSARPAEDIQAILNRFQTWAGKQPENGRKPGSSGVREIPMEEAMRQLRSRSGKAKPPAAEKPSAPQPPVVPVALAPEVASKPEPVTPPASPQPRISEAPKKAERAKPASRRKPVAKAKPWAPAPQVMHAAAPKAQPQVSAPARRKQNKTAKKQAAKRGPAKQAGPAAAKPDKKPTRANSKPAFREVLARSVRPEKSKPNPVPKTKRPQRVSVRLSRAEEWRLQQRASQAGFTISEFLRRSALDANPQPADAARERPAAKARGSRPATAAALFASAANQNSSMLGGWLALLRNRFLASPARFSERA